MKLRSSITVDLDAYPIFDRYAGRKIQVKNRFSREIVFPAPYAVYAMKGHGRDINRSALFYNNNIVEKAFEEYYLREGQQGFRVPQAIGYATRQLLHRMREWDLDAPGPRPPERNPFRNRLRRITGRLADTAYIRRGDHDDIIPSADKQPFTKERRREERRKFKRRRSRGSISVGKPPKTGLKKIPTRTLRVRKSVLDRFYR